MSVLTTLGVFNYGLVLLYGLFLSTFISGGWENTKQRTLVFAACPLFLMIQSVCWLALVILALAVFNHVLRERMGTEYVSHAMWLTMHLPFFLLFLYITKCGVIKMAFMILSAFTFTAPTIVVSSVVMRHFGNSRWMLLVSNLVSYALILLLAQFVFRRGFNYLIKYGDVRRRSALSAVFCCAVPVLPLRVLGARR